MATSSNVWLGSWELLLLVELRCRGALGQSCVTEDAAANPKPLIRWTGLVKAPPSRKRVHVARPRYRNFYLISVSRGNGTAKSCKTRAVDSCVQHKQTTALPSTPALQTFTGNRYRLSVIDHTPRGCLQHPYSQILHCRVWRKTLERLSSTDPGEGVPTRWLLKRPRAPPRGCSP